MLSPQNRRLKSDKVCQGEGKLRGAITLWLECLFLLLSGSFDGSIQSPNDNKGVRNLEMKIER